jgi:hypothetical protein
LNCQSGGYFIRSRQEGTKKQSKRKKGRKKERREVRGRVRGKEKELNKFISWKKKAALNSGKENGSEIAEEGLQGLRRLHHCVMQNVPRRAEWLTLFRITVSLVLLGVQMIVVLTKSRHATYSKPF